jgi:flagellar biosynthetic protein FliS
MGSSSGSSSASSRASSLASPRLSDAPPDAGDLDGPDGPELRIPDQYELLLAKISRAEEEFEAEGVGGRSLHLEEASAIVFDLLYSLDFKSGGELVPRLAGLYGYIANELLNVGRTRDKSQLAHLRDMITTLRQSWYGAQNTASAQR